MQTTKKLTVEEVADKIRQERQELKCVQDALEFFRDSLRSKRAVRHSVEVNFTRLLEPHWNGLCMHSRISSLLPSRVPGVSDGALTLEQIREIMVVLVGVIGNEEILEIDFIEKTDKFVESQPVYKTYPWTKLYAFMLRANMSMIQCAIMQAHWKSAVLAYQRTLVNLTRDQRREQEILALDPLNLSTKLRNVVKELNRLQREHEPIQRQFDKYAERLELSQHRIDCAKLELSRIEEQLQTLTREQRESTVRIASAKRGGQVDYSDLNI